MDLHLARKVRRDARGAEGDAHRVPQTHRLTGDLFFVEKMAPSAMRDIYAFISRRLETERGVFVQHEPDERFKSKYMRSK